jgi:hypothetical protein
MMGVRLNGLTFEDFSDSYTFGFFLKNRETG